jgi:uncharacterized metal-binding protein YceD (DUF177 family)
MSNSSQILIDRLKQGQTQLIQERFSPDFLDIQEEELKNDSPISVSGEAYVSETELLLHVNASTSVSMPCAICNQFVSVPLSVHNFYHAEPLDDIPSAIFDYQPLLREALLLELPKYVECNQGKCPARATLTPYLKPEARAEETNHFPFSQLDS